MMSVACIGSDAVGAGGREVHQQVVGRSGTTSVSLSVTKRSSTNSIRICDEDSGHRLLEDVQVLTKLSSTNSIRISNEENGHRLLGDIQVCVFQET